MLESNGGWRECLQICILPHFGHSLNTTLAACIAPSVTMLLVCVDRRHYMHNSQLPSACISIPGHGLRPQVARWRGLRSNRPAKPLILPESQRAVHGVERVGGVDGACQRAKDPSVAVESVGGVGGLFLWGGGTS